MSACSWPALTSAPSPRTTNSYGLSLDPTRNYQPLGGRWPVHVGCAMELWEVLVGLTGRRHPTDLPRPWNVSAAEPVLDRQTRYTTEVTVVARDQGKPTGQHD